MVKHPTHSDSSKKTRSSTVNGISRMMIKKIYSELAHGPLNL